MVMPAVDVDGDWRADLAAVDDLGQPQPRRPETPFVPHHQFDIVFLGSFNHLPTVVAGQGHRFFTKDVLASPGGSNGLVAVLVVSSC